MAGKELNGLDWKEVAKIVAIITLAFVLLLIGESL